MAVVAMTDVTVLLVVTLVTVLLVVTLTTVLLVATLTTVVLGMVVVSDDVCCQRCEIKNTVMGNEQCKYQKL